MKDKEIYLISSDGWRESIKTDYYATNDEELKAIVLEDLKEYYSYYVIKSISVQFDENNEKIITVDYYLEWEAEEDLQTKIYYTFKLNKYEHI